MTCAKRVVTCELVPLGDQPAVFGANLCASPQPVCPRKDGEGYIKCKTVCKQDGHAEIQALAAARRKAINLRGATAIVSGHYYVCESCASALKDAGVADIVIHMG